MKKIFMMLGAALMVACGAAEQKGDGVTITGDLSNLEGLEAGMTVSVVLMGQEEPAAEAVLAEDLTFTLKVDSDREEFASFMLDGQPVAGIALDGNDMTVSYNLEEDYFDFVGSALNDELSEVMDGFIVIFESEESTEEDLFAYIDEYVVANPDSAASVYMLQYYTMFGGDEARFIELFNMVDDRFEYLSLYEQYADYVLYAPNTVIGADILDIVLPNSEGEAIAVKDICAEGKWVLIDFWATWCGPCRGEIPYLVAAYERFKPLGLEIYGVSFDRPGTEDRWVQFVEANNMTWINVWGSAEDGGWDVAEPLNVQGIPSNFLYSPEGKLVAKNLRGEDVERILVEHLE